MRKTLMIAMLMTLPLQLSANNGWVLDDTRTAARTMKERGVYAYRMASVDGLFTVQLLDKWEAMRAVVTTRRMRDGSHEFTYASDDVTWQLNWNPSERRVLLSDASGEYSYVFDLTSRVIRASERALATRDTYAASIATTMQALDDIRDHGLAFESSGSADVRAGGEARFGAAVQSGDWSEDPSCLYGACDGEFDEDLTWGDTYGGGPASYCNGKEVRGEASPVSDLSETFSRSYLCRVARNNARLLCWNQYCTGCCHYSTCDALCLISGDYICLTAGIIGRSCSAYPNP